MSDWYTPEQVAEKLEVTPATVRYWLRKGQLDGEKLAAGRWRISTDALAAFLAGRGERGD